MPCPFLPRTVACVLSLLIAACASPEAGDDAESPTPDAAPASSAANDDSFRLDVLDSFTVFGHPGAVATGVIASGQVAVGDALCLTHPDGAPRLVVVDGLEQFREPVETASVGDNVGVRFASFDDPDLTKGGTLSAESDC